MPEKEMRPSARPVSSAFLICDQVITETGSKKKTIVGVFSSMWVPVFPAMHSKVALYFRGFVAKGDHDFWIDYCQKGSEEAITRVEGVLHVHAENTITELAVHLPFLEVPAPGEYEFRMWIAGSYVQRVGFKAGLLKLREEAENDR